jgi:low affinity Fe/Cu permease
MSAVTHRATATQGNSPSDQQPGHSPGREMKAVNETFRRLSHKTSAVVGSPLTFMVAVLIIILWALVGPLFHFSDTWQLVINTGTTIVTFLMVFLIQNTQNRDARAIHLKLDELIRSKKGARNMLVDLEDCTDEELAEMEQEFRKLREQAHHRRRTVSAHPHAARNLDSAEHAAAEAADALGALRENLNREPRPAAEPGRSDKAEDPDGSAPS